MQSSPTLIPIRGTSMMHLKTDCAEHQPMTGLVAVMEGLLSKKEMADIITNRLLSQPSGYRFQSIVLPSGYFQVLPTFDPCEVLQVSTFKTSPQSHAPQSDECAIPDEGVESPSEESEGSSYGSSSESSEREDSADSTAADKDGEVYSVMEPFLSAHIEQYHNVDFSHRDTLPLWRGHLLHFPDLNRTIFYLKAHHALCDGISLSRSFLSLADNFAAVHEEGAKRLLQSKGYQKYQGRWDNPLLYLLFLIVNSLRWLLDFFAMMFVHIEAESIIRPQQQTADKSYSVLFDIDTAAIDCARKSPPFDGKRVTVNDFLLTVIAEALSRFVSDYDICGGRGLIRAGTIVSMSARDPLSVSLNNCVGVGMVDLPLCSDRRMAFADKLAMIKAQMDSVKGRHYALFSSLMMEMMGALPRRIVNLMMRLQNSAVIVSNINGPTETLFLDGHRVLSASGIVQNHHGVSLSFCITGYDGTCSVSLLADRKVCGERSAAMILEYVEKVLREKGCM